FEQDHVHRSLLARDVGQQRNLTGPLDGDGDLPLMPTARAGDAAVAALAPLGGVVPQLVGGLVVHPLHLFPFVVAAFVAPLGGAGGGCGGGGVGARVFPDLGREPPRRGFRPPRGGEERRNPPLCAPALAGTNEPPPPPPPSESPRPPRNWTLSATISTAWR